VGTLLTEPESLSGESLPVPGLAPWDCLARARAPEASGQPMFVWEAPGGEALAGIGALCRIEAVGAGRFEDIRRRIGSVLSRGGHRGPTPEGFPGAIAIGGFSFAEQGQRRGWPGFADGSFHVPERVFWRAPGGETVETRWSAAGAGIADEEPDGEPEATPGWDRGAWMVAVRRTLEQIRDGALSKAVLARSLRSRSIAASTDRDPRLPSRRLPDCFNPEDGNGNAFLGASPERLVRLTRGEVLTEAVAGTQRCEPGDDAAELARALLERSKDRSEHEIVLQHLLGILGPICETLEAPKTPEVMKLPHLLHLRTAVRGRPRPGAHVLDLVSRLHPTPAVAGWPRSEALDWIHEIEGAQRGWYAGPVGWVNAAGEGDFAVGIRSVAIRGDKARVFAGAGIVEGSDPEQEWNETEIKMRGMLDAIARD
jgi:salicylate biosynthesis isochorismate synthase